MTDGLTSEQLRIGRVLLAEGPLTTEYIKEQMNIEGTEGVLAKAVLASGHASESEIVMTLLARYRVPKVHIQRYPIPEKAVSLLSVEDARRFRAIPLGKVGNITCLAMENLFQMEVGVIYQLRRILGGPVKLFQVSPQDMDNALDKYYPLPKKEVVKPVRAVSSEIKGLQRQMIPYEHTEAFWRRNFTSEGPLKAVVVEKM